MGAWIKGRVEEISRRTRGSSGLFVAVMTLITIAVLLVACDPGPDEDHVGVTLANNSHVRILFVPCADELVKQVRLVQIQGQIIGDADDGVLWRISSDNGSLLVEVEPGLTAPPGFSTLVSLGDALPSGDLAVLVDTTRLPSQLTVFRASDLAKGIVLSHDDHLSFDEFRTRAILSCH